MHLICALLIYLNPWVFLNRYDTVAINKKLQTAKGIQRIEYLYISALAARNTHPERLKTHALLIKHEAPKVAASAYATVLSYRLLGDYAQHKNNKELAIKYLDTSLHFAQLAKNKQWVINTYYAVGSFYSSAGMQENAFKSHMKAIDLAKSDSNKSCIPYIVTELGTTQYRLANYDEALKYYLQGYNLIKNKPQDKVLTVPLLNNIGLCYGAKSQLEKATFYYKKAIQLAGNEPRFEELKAVIIGNIGGIYFKKNDYLTAAKYLEQDRTISYQKNNVDSYINATLTLALCYARSGKIDRATALVHEIETTTITGMRTWLTGVYYYRIAAEIAELAGDVNKANAIYKKSIKAIDSLNQKQLKERLNTISATYELAVKEKELQANKRILEANQEALNAVTFQRTILVLAFLFGIGLAIMILYNLRQKTKLAAELAVQTQIITTKNQQAEAANRLLEKAIAQRTSILGVVSHDLKAPISRVQGLLELTKLDPDNEPSYRSMLEVSISDANALIKNLLDDAAIDEGRRDPKPSHFDLALLCQELVTGLSINAHHKGIDLAYESRLQKQDIFTDRHLLTRILENLLSNALKFSPKGSRVTLNLLLDEQHDTIRLLVNDQGPGISDEEQAKIFQPFARGKAVPTAGESTTGLGLSIVSRLAQLLHGNIGVKSQLGEGATFILQLPLVYPSAQA